MVMKISFLTRLLVGSLLVFSSAAGVEAAKVVPYPAGA